MALPPQTIRIKRPRDEAPVSALYVDNTPTKRQKFDKPPNFIFRLIHTVTSPTDPTPRPFQPRHSSPRRYGVPKIRSIVRPGPSAPSPISPGTALPVTPLTPRSMSPQDALRDKLVLDTATAISPENALLKAPVPLSAISATSGGGIVASPIVSPSSPASDSPIESPERGYTPPRHDTFGSETPRAGGFTPTIRPEMQDTEEDQAEEDGVKTGSKRKITPVRRYHLARRLRVKHSHPYSNATRRSAIFMRVFEQARDADRDRVADVQPEMAKERKRPRTHPEEKKLWDQKRNEEEQQRKGKEKEVNFLDQKTGEDDRIAAQLQSMVLEYLSSASNDGIRNLPLSSPSFPVGPTQHLQSRIGGGVGGGTWAKGPGEAEDDEGFVYDVYFREELPVSTEKKMDSEDYGVLVIDGSEEEEWWYEGDRDEGSDDDVWASEDEDSNAEDFHANDYPEEPTFDSDGDMVGLSGGYDSGGDESTGSFRPWARTGRRIGDEEYDLDDSEDGDEEFNARRGIWGIATGDEADDEDEE